MNLPNRLTLLRIVLVPLYLVLLLWELPFHYVTALAVFIAAALTDLLDGRIARARGLVTDFGKFLDPIADKMLTTAAFLGFLSLGVTDVWAVMLILTREFMVTSVRLMAAGDGTVVAASFSGKLKTVAQYIAVIAMMLSLEWQAAGTTWLACASLPEAAYTAPVVVSQIFIWISVVLTWISGIQYFRQYRHCFFQKG